MKSNLNLATFSLDNHRGEVKLDFYGGYAKGGIAVSDPTLIFDSFQVKAVGYYGFDRKRFFHYKPDGLEFTSDSGTVFLDLKNPLDFDSLMDWNILAVDDLNNEGLRVLPIQRLSELEETVTTIMRKIDSDLSSLFLGHKGEYQLKLLKAEKNISPRGKKKFIEKKMHEYFPSLRVRRSSFHFSSTTRDLVSKINEKYTSSSKSLEFIPPSERRSLVVEATTGCDYNACTFCDCFSGEKFRQRSIEDVIENLNDIKTFFGRELRYLDKVFIGTGNGLSLPTNYIARIINFFNSKFDDVNISTYGRVKDILSKGSDDCFELSRLGLDMVYWGAESGSDFVLDYVNKGQTFEEMIQAAKILKESFIKQSVMFMPGLGGIKYFEEHMNCTANFISVARPEYVTFLGITSYPNTKYDLTMRQEIREGTNRPLTDKEIIEQVRGIISSVELYGGKFGMHTTFTDKVGTNPVTFNDVLFDEDERSALLSEIDEIYKVTP